MGSFANTLFSALLGWLQGAVSWLWRAAAGADAGAWMRWVLDNWLVLALLLCAAGLLIDLLIYLIRWQPYRVWMSFLRRGHQEEEEEEAPPQVSVQRKWVYADGTTAMEEVPVEPVCKPKETQEHREEQHLDAPVRPVKRVIPARHRRTSDGSDEYILPDLTDEQAYHQPYYPPQWSRAERSAQTHKSHGGNQ